MKYSHYSFDLWLTLIKSNPEFKIRRAKFFHKELNPLGLSLAEVNATIRGVDLMCNTINETTGGNLDALEMYAMVLYKMGHDLKEFSIAQLSKLYAQVEKIFLNYQPEFYCSNTLGCLESLVERGCSISILSNTGYVKSTTLLKSKFRSTLLGLSSFNIFSDVENCSKPSPDIFELLVNKAAQQNRTKVEILHVGDNPLADIAGATKFGIASFQINSNNNSIKDLP